MRWSRGLVLSSTLLTAMAPGLAASAASPGPDPSGPAASGPPTVYPHGIVVIGHSGATGYDSDPMDPSVDIRANSWATGTNPRVRSVYQRVLEQDPAVEGNVWNLAIDGSDVQSLIGQAERAVALTPAPELVLVQSIDNDIRCDGTDDDNQPLFRVRLAEVMDILTEGLPSARILFVSQWADVRTYDDVVSRVRVSHLAGDGLCDVADPTTGKLLPDKEAYLQELVDGYFAIITEVCTQYPTCSTDGGGMQTMELAPGDLSPDLNHLSVPGHAKMAGIVWDVLYPSEATLPGASTAP